MSTEVIAHRGSSQEAPENTMAAFKKAWKEEADALEIDVRRSRDGYPVVIHDATLWRTGSGREWKVAQKTLEQLKKVDVGAWKEPIPSWTGERIPTLLETLKSIPPKKRIFIEIKCEEDIIDQLKSDLYESQISLKQVVITSFQLPVIKEVKSNIPAVSIVWVRGALKPHDEEGEEEETGKSLLLRQCKEAGAVGLSCRMDTIDEAFVAEVRKFGLRLYAWTVNSTNDLNSVMSLGVDGVITDCPGEIKRKLRLYEIH